MAVLILIWDYDSALGQTNATYPYKFDQEKIFLEIQNVDHILKVGQEHHLKMVFACLGFAAEVGPYPFCIPEQIQRIHALGHEIASHSWRHEWFPYLEKDQIRRSLERSKYALETCLGIPGAVQGFVPPFNRPMTWQQKGAFSLGDRALYPFFPGADLGSILKFVHDANYCWCRVGYRPQILRLLNLPNHPLTKKRPETVHGVACIRSHYFGFDEPAIRLVEQAVRLNTTVIISAHPSGLSRTREESPENFTRFIDCVASFQEKGLLKSQTVQEYLGSLYHDNE